MSQMPVEERPAADPSWRLEHFPMLTAVSVALVFFASSAGFLLGGPDSALGAAAGVLIVSVSYSVSMLVIAWADTVRPGLLMPLGLITYVVKYSLLGVVLALGVAIEWPGWVALGWGIVAGVAVWTGMQVWSTLRSVKRK